MGSKGEINLLASRPYQSKSLKKLCSLIYDSPLAPILKLGFSYNRPSINSLSSVLTDLLLHFLYFSYL